MKCEKCGYDKGQEYFRIQEIPTDETQSVCAKCYTEFFLETQPYFYELSSGHNAEGPLRQHYMAASLIKLITENQRLLERIMDSLLKPEGIAATNSLRLVLLWNETLNALELSTRLALNNYDRTAISELRFAFEKYVDFAYLLLSFMDPHRKKNETSFEEWINGNMIKKSSMKYRCDALNERLSYEPYVLFRLLSRASHGTFSFLKQEAVFGMGAEYLFFRFLRWFDACLWVIQVIYDINNLFKADFSISNPSFDELQQSYNEILEEHEAQLNEVKTERFFECTSSKHNAKFWMDFDGLILDDTKSDLEPKLYNKLLDEYQLSLSLAVLPSDDV